MTEFDFLLEDRITKIKSMNDMFHLEESAYISFSGGKDSTVLSALVDMAIPNRRKSLRQFVGSNKRQKHRAILGGGDKMKLLLKVGDKFSAEVEARLENGRLGYKTLPLMGVENA